jgi:CheY-like chemotaxis protein/DNA-binding XRE family transcriptional regulator
MTNEVVSMVEPNIKQRFGANVKTWRLRRGISQERLAERAKLHRTYITDVERGARNLSLESMERLAIALEISLPALFTSARELPMLLNDPRRPSGSASLVDILLVEDNLKDVDLTLRAFKKSGLNNQVHVIHDGDEALEFLFGSGRHAGRKDEPLPLIVLLDLNLPKLGGIEVLRSIKANERTSMISVVVLTVSESDGDFQASQSLGADAYIVKPVNFQRFCNITPQLACQWALLRQNPTSPTTP